MGAWEEDFVAGAPTGTIGIVDKKSFKKEKMAQ
jgi:hypothetical protein